MARGNTKSTIVWLLMSICTIGAALLAVMLAVQDASARRPPDPEAGWFQRCSLAKTGSFDPIVFPGMPPDVGHQHLYFGSTAISYNSSASDLQAGGSTCRFNAGTVDPVDGGNNSGYWVPDLMLRNDEWAGGAQVNAYYKKGASSINAQKVEPFPEGLKMVIRDRNNNQTKVDWYCSALNGEGNNGKFAGRPYDCDSTTYKYVTAHITFPQCGTGAIDSQDHISHMAYPGANGCPSTHRRVFPRLNVTVKYNTPLGSGAQLATEPGEEDPAHADPATGFHADYFEGWKPGTLKPFVDTCIRGGINCFSGGGLPQ